MSFIQIDDALSCVIENSSPGIVFCLPINKAVNYYLSNDIIAPIALPSFNNSAMDGFVFLYEDYKEGIRVFDQKGEVKAGDSVPKKIERGSCYRIFTGAPIPPNGSLVIMQEHISTEGYSVVVEEENARPNQNIRKAGEQVKKGQVALSKGVKLTPPAIGYLASLGVNEVMVHKKPQISILATGNELVAPGKDLLLGQIFESNSFALSAALNELGIHNSLLSTVNDDYEVTFNAIKSHIELSDFLILTGGISVGKYDFVFRALNELDVETVFYKVNQKPGKPFFFGKKGGCLVFALPGNPAAAMTCFYYYILPAIRVHMGARESFVNALQLPIKKDFVVKGTRDLLLKSYYDINGVTILEGQSSNMMYTFALANSITQICGTKERIEAGELVKVIPI